MKRVGPYAIEGLGGGGNSATPVVGRQHVAVGGGGTHNRTHSFTRGREAVAHTTAPGFVVTSAPPTRYCAVIVLLNRLYEHVRKSFFFILFNDH